MTRLLASASIIAIACTFAYPAFASEQGAATAASTPRAEAPLAFHAAPAFALGQPFTGTVFTESTVLSVTPVSPLLSPELFAPDVTGARATPASPTIGSADRNDSFADRFITTTNRFAGPRDALRSFDLGLHAEAAPQTAAWEPVGSALEQRLTDYAFDFGAEDLTGAVVDNNRVLALFGWNGEIDAPVVAQGD